MWVSFDEGEHWDSLQGNLPHTSMRDLAIHGQDLILATHGRSFWILDDISPLRQVDALAAPGEAALLAPAPAVRIQRDTNTDTPIPPDEPAGRNPPDGAVIDYYLAKRAATPLVLEILDAAGAAVRRFSSTDPPPYTAADLAHELIPAYWIRMPQTLASSAGLHRWVWDLRYPAPRAAQRGFPIAAVPGDTPQTPLGPSVVPGNYRVRLSLGAHHWEQPLQVLPDPRVQLPAEGYAQQLQLARQLAGALDESTAALLAARSLRAQAQAVAEHAGAALGERLKSFTARVTDLIGTSDDAAPAGTAGAAETSAARRHLLQLNTDLAALYDQVLRADAAPTAAQGAASAAALGAWRALQGEWQPLRGPELAALNASLQQASLGALRAELAPPRDLDLADVE